MSGLLTESQAAALAGVAIDTIRQYGEFGLLSRTTQDEQVLYREAEIRTLFYTTAGAPPEPRNGSRPAESAATAGVENAVAPAAERPNNSAQPDAGIPPDSAASNTAPQKPTQSCGGSPAADEAGQQAAPAEHAFVFVQASNTEFFDASRPMNGRRAERTHASPLEHTAPDSLHELSDLNRSLREQIQLLREERDWLRERIEKLETRSEREQMLLLAESETVRNLVRREQKPRSFWSFALPWLGLSDETNERR